MLEERIERKSNGKFIRVIPVLEEDSNVFTGIVGQVDLPIYLGAAGNSGYNIQFTTDKRLEEVVGTFSGFLSPLSIVSAHHREISYNLPQISSDDKKRFADLSPEILRRLSEVKHLFFYLELLEQGTDQSKFAHFWYEVDIDGPMLRTFGINLNHYRDDIMEMAYKVTNFPVRPEDVRWLKSILDVPVKRL